MALPLTVPTFYRMPDASPTGTTIADMLTAIYSTLTSSVDYRGTSIPSSHLWTWATGSTSGSISAIYNTAIPSGSPLTQNPTIIIAGFSGSASPTMNSSTGDTYASSSILIGVNKNGGAYNDWTAALPMTTGGFTGFQRLATSASNLTTTVVRTYISQELIFIRINQAITNEFWAFAGAIIEPYTSYNDSLTGIARSAETDDRIYGVNSSATTAIQNNFTVSNLSILYNRGSIFQPTANTLYFVSRRNNYNLPGSTNDIDFDGNFIYERIKFMRWSGGAVIGNAAVGTLNGIYYTCISRANKLVVRNGTTDLYHIIAYNNTTAINGNALALKAAP
jgi:hypothetical protein